MHFEEYLKIVNNYRFKYQELNKKISCELIPSEKEKLRALRNTCIKQIEYIYQEFILQNKERI